MPRRSIQETIEIGTKDPKFTTGIRIGRDAARLNVSEAATKHSCSQHTARYWRDVFNAQKPAKSAVRKDSTRSKASTSKPRTDAIIARAIDLIGTHKRQLDSLEKTLLESLKWDAKKK